MKATLVIISGRKKIAADLGSEQLAQLVQKLPPDPKTQSLWGLLAGHSSSEVREQIASKSHLSPKTIARLAQDPSVDVIRALVRSEAGEKWLSTDQLLAIAQRDSEAASAIGNSVGAFASANTLSLARGLARLPDPRGRQGLASNVDAPKSIRRRLRTDPDAGVRAAARDAFEG